MESQREPIFYSAQTTSLVMWESRPLAFVVNINLAASQTGQIPRSCKAIRELHRMAGF
jgi:hypothetical protein